MSTPTVRAQRIQSALRAMAAQDCETVIVRPYAAYIDHENDLPFFSCAIPQPGAAAPWDREPIERLKDAFAAAGRRPRLEVVEACWPGLADALAARGFGVEERLAGMTCAADAIVDGGRSPGLTLERVDRRSADGAIAGLLAVKWAPFEGLSAPAVDAAAVARYRRSGAPAVIARTAEGDLVGSAGWIGVQDGVSEIVAVGVLRPFRRRGIAGALIAAAGRAAADGGADLLFLTYEDAGAGRVYERAGFTVAEDCTMLKLECAGVPT